MSDGFVMPLSGAEIRSDILAQIEKRLEIGDCNLRDTDAYSGGYSGTVTVKLKLHSLDTATVEMEIPITGIAPEGEPQSTGEVEVEATVEIPLESDLDEVRERSGQGVPIQTLDAEHKPTIKKRTFARPKAVGMAVSE